MAEPFFPRCDCCGTDGSDGRFVTVEVRNVEPMRATCEFCRGLLDAGLIREEWHGNPPVRRFRQWHVEWVKGELLPRATVVGA